MEPHAPLFPSFIAPLSDLYGVSSFRVAESQAYALDLEDLDREERALELTVRALVDRKAPTPIGLNFHRASANSAATNNISSANSSMIMNQSATNRLQRGGVAPVGSEGSRLGSGVQTSRGYHGHVAEDDEEDEVDEEDDMEEDELEELDDEEEEEEDADDPELFAGDDEEDEDEEEEDGDHRAGDSDSMDMSM